MLPLSMFPLKPQQNCKRLLFQKKCCKGLMKKGVCPIE